MFDSELMKRAAGFEPQPNVDLAWDAPGASALDVLRLPLLTTALGALVGAAGAPDGRMGRGALRGGVIGAGTGIGGGLGSGLGALGGAGLGAGLGALSKNPRAPLGGAVIGAGVGGIGGLLAGAYGGNRLTRGMIGPAPWEREQSSSPPAAPPKKKPKSKKPATKEAAARNLLSILGL